jgi:hypothetical protein
MDPACLIEILRATGATASPFACVMAFPEVGLVFDGAPRSG